MLEGSEKNLRLCHNHAEGGPYLSDRVAVMATGDWAAEMDAIHLKNALNFDIMATALIASS